MDVVDRLITDLEGHPRRDEFSVTWTEGPDLSQLAETAIALGLMDRPSVVIGGSLIAAGVVSSVHLAFFTFGEDELVDCADQTQDFLHQHFVVTWPESPVHGDPMWPGLFSDRATWACHRDWTMRREIGSLRACTERGNDDEMGSQKN